MEQLHQRFGSQGLVIMALNYQEGFEQVKAFVEQHRLSFTALRHQDGAVLRKYSMMGLPTSYLIAATARYSPAAWGAGTGRKRRGRS